VLVLQGHQQPPNDQVTRAASLQRRPPGRRETTSLGETPTGRHLRNHRQSRNNRSLPLWQANQLHKQQVARRQPSEGLRTGRICNQSFEQALRPNTFFNRPSRNNGDLIQVRALLADLRWEARLLRFLETSGVGRIMDEENMEEGWAVRMNG